MPTEGLLLLFQLFDALFPVGTFTLSNGMETYTQKGLVWDKGTLVSFLKAQVALLPYADMGVAAGAAKGGDIFLLDQICAAMKQPFEARRGSEKQCARLMKLTAAMGEFKSLAAYRVAMAAGACDGHYPVAAGLAMRDAGAGLPAALTLYGYSLLSATVSNAVKLIPLGQTEGQSALYEVAKGLPEAAKKALAASCEELGASGGGFDLRAMQHESLAGRLYIS